MFSAIKTALFIGLLNTQIVAESYPDALYKSYVSHRPVLVHLTADWCSPCQQMKEQVYGSEKIKNELKRFVLLDVEVDKRNRHTLAEKFEINTIPAWIIIDHKKKKPVTDSGYKDENNFYKFLTSN